MTHHHPAPGRRALLGAALAATLPAAAGAQAPQPSRPVQTINGVRTTADIARAEAEGEMLFYTHDGEGAAAAVVDAFTKTFPRIKGQYFRAQNGALYSKVLAERSAGRFNVDVIQFSEIGTALDFQKRGGYERHELPEAQAFDARYLGDPQGAYFLAGVTFGGICYNTDKVSAAEAPRSWKDLLDPKWRNAMSTKQSTSGMQFVEWYELRKLYGPQYWRDFAKQRPRGFDSRVQLFDRLAKGDDKICALAEYAGYLLYKEKGAPIAFIAPEDGLPATPVVAGMASKAPHPEAARLYLDWLMSPIGQKVYQENPQIYYPSYRHDAPQMPGGKKLSEFKLLSPADLADYLGSRDAFNKEWNAMLGL